MAPGADRIIDGGASSANPLWLCLTDFGERPGRREGL
jgi:hypothetical protein